jgi:hypothetical protein
MRGNGRAEGWTFGCVCAQKSSTLQEVFVGPHIAALGNKVSPLFAQRAVTSMSWICKRNTTGSWKKVVGSVLVGFHSFSNDHGIAVVFLTVMVFINVPAQRTKSSRVNQISKDLTQVYLNCITLSFVRPYPT